MILPDRIKIWQGAVLLILGLALVGGLAWEILHARQPVYQGKTLAAWLDQYKWGFDVAFVLGQAIVLVPPAPQGISGSSQRMVGTTKLDMPAPKEALRREAAEAVQHIGTNAISHLLKMATVHDSPAKAFVKQHPGATAKLVDVLRLGPSYQRWSDQSAVAHGRALVGIRLLGRSAKPAVETLIRLLRSNANPDVRRTAADSLGAIGLGAQAATPALTEIAEKDPDASVRAACSRALTDVFQF